MYVSKFFISIIGWISNTDTCAWMSIVMKVWLYRKAPRMWLTVRHLCNSSLQIYLIILKVSSIKLCLIVHLISVLHKFNHFYIKIWVQAQPYDSSWIKMKTSSVPLRKKIIMKMLPWWYSSHLVYGRKTNFWSVPLHWRKYEALILLVKKKKSKRHYIIIFLKGQEIWSQHDTLAKH